MVCSLNGTRLIAVAPVVWESRPGVAPSSTVVVADREAAERINQRHENVTLRIGERVIEKLRIIKSGSASGVPGEHMCYRFHLVDQRYLWARIKYTASFNLRRRTGEIEIAEGDAPLAVRDLKPVYSYYAQTLDAGSPFTLKSALERVLLDTKQQPFVIPEAFPDTDVFGAKGYQKEGSLAEIITGILEFAPGWSVTRDDDGTIRFYDKSNLKEEFKVDGAMRPRLFGGGWSRVSDLSFDRPSKIIVRIYAEPEMRFDYDEQLDINPQNYIRFESITFDEVPVDPTLNAVIDCPVPDLEDDRGNPVARDSQMSMFQFFQSLSLGSAIYPLSPFAKVGPWDYHTITKLYLRPWDVKAQFVNFGTFRDTNWGRITRTSLKQFRRYFRLNQDWQDRVKQIRPFRVELIDPVSLTRRKSPVYGNYLSKPVLRMSSVFSEAEGDDLAWCEYEGFNEKTSLCRRAPAEIVGVDNEAKSFRVLYKRSPRGRDEDVLPVTIAEDEMPKVINASNLFLKLEIGHPIEKNYKMATILTCLPQPMPGSTSHFHTIEITPDQAAKVLKIDRSRLGDCKGPVWEIIVPPTETTTARFVWSDESRDQMIAPFFQRDAQFPADNLQNPKDCQALAEASAAAVYYSLLDRLDGKSSTAATAAPPGIAGSIKSISTTASPDKSKPIINTVSYGAEFPPRNPYNLLPADVRQRILQQIIPGGE